MSWDRTCCMSTTPSSTGSGSSSTFSPTPLTRDYDLPPPPPPPPSSFFLFSSDEQSTREQEETNSLPPPPPPSSSSSSSVFHNYHHLYSRSDTCLCNSSSSSQIPSYDISSSFQTPFVYEQYLTSLKCEQSEHLPYLFDNIIYPQPCSPPSPTNDSITYYQLDQANTTTIINKFPQHSHIQTIQPIIYQQLSLIEPPSSSLSSTNIQQQQKIPIVKRFYYDSNISNTTTTTIISTTPLVTSTTNDQINLPYARLDSNFFGTYDIWQERILVGRKNNRREIDVNIGSTSVVSRIHFELLLINGIEFHLKCLSKNGIFINNNYIKMSSTTVLPKQCTLRFPSTDLCISFISLLNNNSTHRTNSERISRHISTDISQRRLSSSSSTNPMDITSSGSFQSISNHPSQQQQVIFIGVNHQTQNKLNQDINNNHHHLPPLSINIPNSSSSLSSSSSYSADSCNEQQIKYQHESPTTTTTMNHSFLGSSSSLNLKTEPNEIQSIVNSPIISRESDNICWKNGTKPPFSYAQLIVQAILSASDKQMTLSQIYNFISAQYPYYATNNRGWQNSIRHNLSLNRYFIRLARKENESGKGSFWRLDPTCEEKLIDHAFRHRKQRGNSHNSTSSSNSITKNESEEIHSPTTQYCNDQTDFLLSTSNPCTPLSSMISPLISPNQFNEDYKRKRNNNDDDEIEDLLNILIDSIDHNIILISNQTFKRQKT